MEVDFGKWYDAREKDLLKDFFTYLRFPSVSAQKQHKKDLLDCAKWVKGYLDKRGFKTAMWEGSGHPAIFAERIVSESAPTILFYGHYDVQPPEPLNLWKSKPFEPEIRDGVIFARGAEDNKGQNFYSMVAIEAFFEAYPDAQVNVKWVIEGEEEMGSTTLHEILPKYQKELSADYLLIVDMGMDSWKKPALAIGARGITTFEITLRAMNTDVHSGAFGGIAYNPIRALTELLGGVIDSDGKVVVPGFYEDIAPLTKEEKALLDLGFDREECEKGIGLKAFHAEKGYTQKESVSMRPTFEINGIWGGYTDEGFKTVIPKEASAKISCRLVPNQSPDKVYQKVVDYIRSKVPKGIDVQITFLGGGSASWASPLSPLTKIARQAYKDILGSSHLVYSGGSVPITADLAKYSGAEFVAPGVGLDSDNIHAPNENFSLKQLRTGYLIITRMLELFAQNHST